MTIAETKPNSAGVLWNQLVPGFVSRLGGQIPGRRISLRVPEGSQTAKKRSSAPLCAPSCVFNSFPGSSENRSLVSGPSCIFNNFPGSFRRCASRRVFSSAGVAKAAGYPISFCRLGWPGSPAGEFRFVWRRVHRRQEKIVCAAAFICATANGLSVTHGPQGTWSKSFGLTKSGLLLLRMMSPGAEEGTALDWD
jgi:hypothetical protein